MPTIDPRVNDNLGPLRKLHFGNFGLDALIIQCDPLDGDDLLAVGRRMQIRAESDIALNLLAAQICHRLVKFVLADVSGTSSRLLQKASFEFQISSYSSPQVICEEYATIDLRQIAAIEFGIQVWERFSLCRLVQCDGLEV